MSKFAARLAENSEPEDEELSMLNSRIRGKSRISSKLRRSDRLRMTAYSAWLTSLAVRKRKREASRKRRICSFWKMIGRGRSLRFIRRRRQKMEITDLLPETTLKRRSKKNSLSMIARAETYTEARRTQPKRTKPLNRLKKQNTSKRRNKSRSRATLSSPRTTHSMKREREMRKRSRSLDMKSWYSNPRSRLTLTMVRKSSSNCWKAIIGRNTTILFTWAREIRRSMWIGRRSCCSSMSLLCWEVLQFMWTKLLWWRVFWRKIMLGWSR